MKRLYRYLPPFAGDYSGICSALYELGGMLCIHDASGCTGNYTGFDEPRSYNSKRLVYCTGLRKTEQFWEMKRFILIKSYVQQRI